jgi:hypothetical protein
MEKRYEITVRELTPFSEEELKEEKRRNDFGMDRSFPRYADKPFHEVRVLTAELTPDEWQRAKLAIIKEI